MTSPKYELIIVINFLYIYQQPKSRSTYLPKVGSYYIYRLEFFTDG